MQWNTTVRAYRIDGGKEYNRDKLVQCLKKYRMLSKITTPYIPEQNGVTEYTNRTIFSKVRSAIEDSNLLPELQPEILLDTVYITNCIATSLLNKITLAEAFKRQV